MLRCADDTIYTGIAKDLEKRVAEHNLGKASKYTRARLPVNVVYCEKSKNRSTASKREIEIKKMSRKEKLKLMTGS
jgi:putative endonuclease